MLPVHRACGPVGRLTSQEVGVIPWFKVDDNLAFHAKTVAAGVSAMGLWVRAGAWSSQLLTDGFIPEHMVPPMADGQVELAARLVSAGLWRKVRDGYQFHEWGERNPEAKEVKEKRRKEAARKADWRAAQAEKAATEVMTAVTSSSGTFGDIRDNGNSVTKPRQIHSGGFGDTSEAWSGTTSGQTTLSLAGGIPFTSPDGLGSPGDVPAGQGGDNGVRPEGTSGGVTGVSRATRPDPTRTSLTTSSSETATPPSNGRRKPQSQEPQRDDVDALCNRLRDWMIHNEARPPKITNQWKQQARLLLDQDKCELSKALNLIDWCQQHHFWKSRILSIPKFREQYDKLALQAREEWRSNAARNKANADAIDPDKNPWTGVKYV